MGHIGILVVVVRRLSRRWKVKTPLAGPSPTSPMRRRLPTPLFPTKRDYTAPILEKATLKLIGSVTFSVLVATPFPHPTVNPIATRGFWKNEGPIQVVGHRGDFPRKLSNVKNTKHCTGSGANSIERTNLQIGENTVQVSKAVFIRSRMLK